MDIVFDTLEVQFPIPLEGVPTYSDLLPYQRQIFWNNALAGRRDLQCLAYWETLTCDVT